MSVFCKFSIFLFVSLPWQMNAEAKKYQNKKYDITKSGYQNKEELDDYYNKFKQRASKDLTASLTQEQRSLILNSLLNFKSLEFEQKYTESHKLILDLAKQFPNEPLVLWHVSNSFYTQNSNIDPEDKDKRIAILEQGMDFAKKCVELAPEDGNCWLSWVALHGRRAALKGVFASLFAVHEIYTGMKKAYDFSDNGNFYRNGLRSTNHETATFALIEFYRALPDSFFVEWITKHRGDSKKAYELAKSLKSKSVLNAVALGKSALCWGAKNNDQTIVDEGIKALKQGIDIEIAANSENEEYSRIVSTLNKIEALAPDERNFDNYEKIGCTDYGNDDKDAESAAQR